ncbi:MAG: hypothetical protein K6T88_06380 [Bacillus sp. (in: Bacteria)]|nr:hypothetical protein [Bacillus sp. (in: firmicutes)]
MKKFYLLITILLLLIGCSRQNENNYRIDLLHSHDMILMYSDLCITTCQLYSNNWKIAIENRKDFNKELQNTMEKAKEKGIYDLINNNKSDIDSKMKNLVDPPKSYLRAHEKLVEMYGIYSQLHSLALNPSGSLVSFNNTVNDLQNKLIKTSGEFKVLLPNN